MKWKQNIYLYTESMRPWVAFSDHMYLNRQFNVDMLCNIFHINNVICYALN